jgi:hypothetical protein
MDYSPYYCRNFYKDRRKKTEENRIQSPAIQNCSAFPPTESPETPGCDPARKAAVCCGRPFRSRRKGKVFFSFLLIILCFGIVFLSADMFSGGAVMDSLRATFGSGNLETHYFVAQGIYSQKAKAESEAAVVRETGGAGYLYNTGSGYYVILYSFNDRKAAEAAIGTGSKLEIIEINLREPEETGLSDTQKKLCDETLRMVCDDIKSLYGIISSLSTGAISRQTALKSLTEMRNTLLYKKQELLDGGICLDNAYLALLEPLFGGLDAIVSNEPEKYFLEAVRYVQIGAILAFPRE